MFALSCSTRGPACFYNTRLPAGDLFSEYKMRLIDVTNRAHIVTLNEDPPAVPCELVVVPL